MSVAMDLKISPTGISTEDQEPRKGKLTIVSPTEPKLGVQAHVRLVDLSEDASATPDHMLIGTLPPSSLRLIAPIAVDITVEADNVVVWSEALNLWGEGEDLPSAVRAFQQSVIELYQSLLENSQILGPELQSLRARLNELIAERSST